jgi:hypothetical protein
LFSHNEALKTNKTTLNEINSLSARRTMGQVKPKSIYVVEGEESLIALTKEKLQI